MHRAGPCSCAGGRNDEEDLRGRPCGSWGVSPSRSGPPAQPGQRGPPDGYGVMQTAQVTAAAVRSSGSGWCCPSPSWRPPCSSGRRGSRCRSGWASGGWSSGAHPRRGRVGGPAGRRRAARGALHRRLVAAHRQLLKARSADVVLRPRLDRRVAQLPARPVPSGQHLVYVALDVAKVVALPTLGRVAVRPAPAVTAPGQGTGAGRAQAARPAI